MNTSADKLNEPLAIAVRVHGGRLIVDLNDGRTLSVPLGWYPRLAEGTPKERDHWVLIGSGRGIQWPDIDEDISIAALIDGLASSESSHSLASWRQQRK